jgi:hypothetical protein
MDDTGATGIAVEPEGAFTGSFTALLDEFLMGPKGL